MKAQRFFAHALFALSILPLSMAHSAGCQEAGCPSGSSCEAGKSACEGPNGARSTCMDFQCVPNPKPSLNMLNMSARMTCAPWDGQAYTFVLPDPQGSYGSLRAHVYDSFPAEGKSRSYMLGAQAGRASLTPSTEPQLPTGSEPKGAKGTKLTLLRKGSFLDGTLAISGRYIPFHVAIDPSLALCGGAIQKAP